MTVKSEKRPGNADDDAIAHKKFACELKKESLGWGNQPAHRWSSGQAISFGDRGPGSIPGETQLKKSSDLSKWAILVARTRDRTLARPVTSGYKRLLDITKWPCHVF